MQKANENVIIVEELIARRKTTLHALVATIQANGHSMSWSTLHRCFHTGTEIHDGTMLRTLKMVSEALEVKTGDLFENSGDQYTRELIASWLGARSASLKSIQNKIEKLRGESNGSGNPKEDNRNIEG